MGVAKFGDLGLASGVERGGGEDQDRGVDQQREAKGDGAVDGGVFQRLTLFFDAVAVSAGLHDSGVQVEIVRHQGGPKDAEREVEHLGVAQDLGGGGEAFDHAGPVGIGHGDLERKAERDNAQQGDDEGFQSGSGLQGIGNRCLSRRSNAFSDIFVSMKT